MSVLCFLLRRFGLDDLLTRSVHFVLLIEHFRLRSLRLSRLPLLNFTHLFGFEFSLTSLGLFFLLLLLKLPLLLCFTFLFLLALFIISLDLLEVLLVLLVHALSDFLHLLGGLSDEATEPAKAGR